MSVSDYDPRFVDLWKDGGTKGVELSLPKGDAIALRHRLYRLRLSMRKEKHELADTANRGILSVKFAPPQAAPDAWIGYSTDKQMLNHCTRHGWAESTLQWKLCIYPPNQRFNDVLVAAGYIEEEPPPLE